jgi:FkbH-like protein
MDSELDNGWADWIKLNIGRGCDKDGIFRILLDAGFGHDQIVAEMNYEPTVDLALVTNPLTGQKPKDQDEFSRRAILDNKKLHLRGTQKIPTDLAEIYLLDDFLNQQECERLTALTKSRLSPSVITQHDGKVTSNSYRTSSTCHLSNIDDPLVRDIEDRICRTIGVDASYAEGIQGQYYLIGQEFKPHTDYFEQDQARPDDSRGQRTYTFMVYLTDAEEGGETDFVELGFAIKPKRGRALIWSNLDTQGMPNPNTIHHARPVVRGSKCIITQWFRANGIGPMYIKDRTETTHPEPPQLPAPSAATAKASTSTPDPRIRLEMTPDWADWIELNIARNCDKDGIFKILLDAGFSHDQIVAEMNYEPTVDLALVTNPLTGQKPGDQDEFSQPIVLDNEKLHLPGAQKIPTDLAEVYLLDDFLNQQECERLTTLTKSRLSPSLVGGLDGEMITNSYRTSSTCHMRDVDDPLVRDIDDRICRTIGIHASYTEGIQGQYYLVGQEFKAHTDYFWRPAHFQRIAGPQGQRTYTFMIYLTDVEEGGETDFEKLGVTIKPKRGRALIWSNLDAQGMPNPNTLHHARPVVRGSKCIITQWFRANGIGPMYIKDRTETTHPETTEGHPGRLISPAALSEPIDPFAGALMHRGDPPAASATSPAPRPELPQLPTHPAATAEASTSTPNPRFRLSKYLCRHEWRANVLVTHPLLGTRAWLPSDAAAVLDLFAAGPISLASVQSQVDALHNVTSNLFDRFLQQGFVVPEDADEEHTFLWPFRDQDAKQQIIETTAHTHRTDATPRLQEFTSPRPKWREARDLRVLMLRGCLTQSVADELENIGPSRGFLVSVTTSWTEVSTDFASIDPHLVVLQPSTTGLLGPLWDELSFLDDDEIEQRIDTMCDAVDARLAAVLPNCRNRLLLVHNFSTPQTSPLGVTEFRRTHTFPNIVHRLNEHVAQRLRHNANAMIVDEERLSAAIGKSRLWDDAVSIYSHHGPIDVMDPDLVTPPTPFEAFDVRRPNHLARTFASHYLDLFEVWEGSGRIKCIVVDLDQTLWPGVLAEEGFTFDSDTVLNALKFNWYSGLHQALKILKSRGILLTSCSKNNPDDVFQHWEELEKIADSNGLGHILRRDDFVIHAINWNPKSQNIRTIKARLGFAENALAFIDDNPVERAEVRSELPEIFVLGDVPNLLRHELLTNPAFQTNVETDEARRRTETTTVQLARDHMQQNAPDFHSFLRLLQIELKIHRVDAGDRLERIVDLIQQTDQFNTRSIRHDIDAVAAFVTDPQHTVYSLAVKDRFADYGLVGVLIYTGNCVDTFVLSCQVIGLTPAAPFLIETIRREPDRLPLSAQIVHTTRNEPCRTVFQDTGFTEHDGTYKLQDIHQLIEPPPGIFQIIE